MNEAPTPNQWLTLLAGIAIGAGLASAWFLGNSYAGTELSLGASAATTSSSTTQSLPGASGDVDVANQAAGMSVLVASVSVPPPGVWVAVAEVNPDGSLGNVLGAARVAAPRSGVLVSLLRPTIAGRSYAIVLYRDDGNGIFDLTQDSVYVDFDTGKAVEVLFTTN